MTKGHMMKRSIFCLLLAAGAIANIHAAPAISAATPQLAEAAQASATVPGPARGLPDDQLSPLSVAQLATAEQLLAKGELSSATDYFETALAADPRNRRAFLGLARIAEAQGLFGKAIRFYREALDLNPNDEATIELQGLAYLERGALKMAETNLERLQSLCADNCAPADRLSSALAKKQKKDTADAEPAAPEAEQQALPDEE